MSLRSLSNTNILSWHDSTKLDQLTLHLSAKIKIYSNGTFGEIKDITSVTTYATVYTTGVEYVNDSSACGFDIRENNQSAAIWGAGDINCYLLINGAIKLKTSRVTLDSEYFLRN